MGSLLRVVLVCLILGKRNAIILSKIEDHNMLDSHSKLELWNSIIVEAACSHHGLRAITHGSHSVLVNEFWLLISVATRFDEYTLSFRVHLTFTCCTLDSSDLPSLAQNKFRYRSTRDCRRINLLSFIQLRNRSSISFCNA